MGEFHKDGYYTGRMLVIEDITAFTPALFLKFINEGFVPVVLVDSSGTISWEGVSYGESEGEFTVSFDSTDYVSDVSSGYDEPFELDAD